MTRVQARQLYAFIIFLEESDTDALPIVQEMPSTSTTEPTHVKIGKSHKPPTHVHIDTNFLLVPKVEHGTSLDLVKNGTRGKKT